MLKASDFFPGFEKLPVDIRSRIVSSASERHANSGDMIHRGGDGCTGLILVQKGQLRIFTVSEDGRELTLYRLLERDICLFSASCMLNSISFDLNVTAEKDTDFLLIPSEVYSSVMRESVQIANYTNSIMSSRFSDVMWLIDQLLWKKMDQRIAAFLIEEADLNESNTLKLTHEAIANHLGTAREVVTRMLKYLQNEGAVRLGRGTVTIEDRERLSSIAE